MNLRKSLRNQSDKVGADGVVKSTIDHVKLSSQNTHDLVDESQVAVLKLSPKSRECVSSIVEEMNEYFTNLSLAAPAQGVLKCERLRKRSSPVRSRVKGKRDSERAKPRYKGLERLYIECVEHIKKRNYRHKERLIDRNKMHKRLKQLNARLRLLYNPRFVTESSSDFMDMFKSLVEPLKDIVSSSVGDLFVSFMILTYQMYRSTNAMDAAMAFVAFWRVASHDTQNATHLLNGAVVGMMFAAYKVAKSSVCTEALSDKMREAKNFLTIVLTGDAVAPFRNIFLAVASLKVLNKELALAAFAVLGKPAAMSVIDMIGYIWDQLTKLVRFGEEWWATRSFRAALMQGDPVKGCLTRADALLYYKDKLSIGLPVTGYMPAREFIVACDELISDIDKVVKQSSPLADLRPLRVRGLDIEQAKFDATTLTNCSARAVPMAIILHGMPGVGKSLNLDFICDIWCRLRGYPFKKEIVYPRTMNAEFWDNLQPFSQTIYHFSEMGSVHPTMLNGPDQAIKEILSLVDSLPFCTNQAELSKKGKVFAHPELILADTNNPRFNAEHMFMNPEAFWRRFVFVELTVKPEFQKVGSVGIDPVKASTSLSPDMDRWLYTVTRRNTVSNTSGNDKVILDKGDIYAFAETIQELMIEHLQNQVRAKLVRNTSSSFYTWNKFAPAQFDIEAYAKKIILWEQHLSFKLTRAFYDLNAPIRPEDDWMRDWIWKEFIRQKSIYFPGTQALSDKIRSVFKKKEEISPVEQKEEDTPYVAEYFPPPDITLSEWAHIYWVNARYRVYHTSSSVVHYSTAIPRAILWSLKWTFYLILLLIALFFLDMGFAKQFAVAFARRKLVEEKDKALGRLHLLWTMNVVNPFETEFWRKNGDMIVVATCAFGGLLAAFKFYRKVGVSSTESATTDEVEEKSEAGTSYRRVAIKNSAVWNSRSHVEIPGRFVGEARDLYGRVARNVRRVRVESDSNLTGYILGIKGSYAVINTHTLGASPTPLLRVSYNGIATGDSMVYKDTRLGSDNRIDLGNDLTLVLLKEVLFVDITPHLGDYDGECEMSGYFADKPRTLKFEKGLRTLMDESLGPIKVSDMISYKCPEHAKGMCGLPVLAGDTSIFVAGLHEAGDTQSSTGMAVRLYKTRILDAMHQLRPVFMELSTKGELELQSCLIEPIAQSAFRHEFLPGIEYLGKVPGHVDARQKSALKKSKIHDDVPEIFFNHDMPQTEFFGKPMMEATKRDGEWISPYNNALRKMSKQKGTLDRKILKKVSDELVERFVSGLEGVIIKPLTMEAAIKGAPDDFFIRPINMSTSMGYGFAGKKRAHFADGIPGEELQAEIDRVLKCYEAGETANPIYRACLKDEPRAAEKIRVGKTRVFFIGQCAHLVVARMFLAPFYSLMVEHNKLFCTSVGLNTHSAGADIETFAAFSPRSMAGDYRDYDIAVPFEIGHVASTIVHDVCARLGYNEYALRIVRGLLTDSLFPIVLMLLDLFVLAGQQASGRYATAEDNSLRNLVMLMYGWYRQTDLPFFKYNYPDTYGDDLKNAIKECVLHIFNNLIYQKVCREEFKLDYTSPNKLEELTESINTYEVDFLKRTYKYRTDIGQWVMPLNHNSLIKALQWVMPSRSVPEIEQVKQTLHSIMWELAFHLDEIRHHAICADLARAFNERYEPMDVFEPLSFAHIINQVFGDPTDEYGCPSVSKQPMGVIVTESFVERENVNAHAFKTVLGKSASINGLPILLGHPVAVLRLADFTCCTKYNVNLQTLRDKCEEEMKVTLSALAELRAYGFPDSHTGLRAYLSDLGNVSEPDKALAKLVLLSVRDSLRVTLDFIERYENRFVTESALADSRDGAVNTVTDENLLDTSSDFWSVAAAAATYQPQGSRGNLSLDRFFSRPVEIYTAPITTVTAATINPWELYTLEPSVRAKLKNFAFMRGTLHMRLAISGTPFDYGLVMASYQPLGVLNTNLSRHKTNLITSAAWRPLMVNYLSQERSSCVMSVCENAPVELSCPFVFPKPYARLYNPSATVLASGDSFTDMFVMGTLEIVSMGTIGATSTGAPAPRMTVYAWMTDVDVCGPTGTIMELVTESGDPDERKTGPVERLASRAAEVSGYLAKVPYIGVYANASSIAFGALKRVAAIFGWSRPSDISDPTNMRPSAFASGALTIARDTAAKLTIDPLQELTIDPRCAGSDSDEMVISSIAGRMTHYDRFLWSQVDNPLADVIWKQPIYPRLGTTTTYSGSTAFQPTALAFAAMPFGYWRGDLVFRFKFANNNFFRGKLAIIYEPNIYQETVITASTCLNKQYVRVVDIQETNTVDFCVNWCSHRDWLQNIPASADPSGYLDRQMGFVYVTPFTQLISTNEVPLEVHVFVAGKNMSFNQLCADYMPTSRVNIYSPGLRSSFVTESGNPDVANAQVVSCLELNDCSDSQIHIREEYFGEQPLSFRALLKRYATNRVTSVGASTGDNRYLSYVQFIFPTNILPYGSSTSTPLDLYSYLKYGYLGLRGSYRHRLYWTNTATPNNMYATRVSLIGPDSYTSPATGPFTGSGRATVNGTHTIMQTVNNAVEFETPMYTNTLFFLAFADVQPGSDIIPANYTRTYRCDIQVSSIVASVIAEEMAAGEDFSFLRFQGAPFHTLE